MADLFLWVKALHVISVIAWMAGMLYLPRLFIYHVEAGVGSPQAATFKTMEEKLLRIIINPAMIATWLFGLSMIFMPGGWWHVGVPLWLWVKFALVLILSAYHGWLSAERKRLANDEIRYSSKTYRILNEVPALLMIAIVILVIVRPF